MTLLTIVFFWLVEHAQLQRYILAFLPLERRAGARDAWNEVEGRLGLWVRGQLILMGAIGLASGIAYTLLGLPGAVLLALIAAIAQAIPIVGPLIGAIPAVLVATTVSPELALIVAGVAVVLQLIEGSVLVPLVMRNTVGISPLLVLLSVLVGAAVGGIVGALLAVPIAASAEIVLARLQARETPVAQDPAAVETPDEDERDEARAVAAGRGRGGDRGLIAVARRDGRSPGTERTRAAQPSAPTATPWDFDRAPRSIRRRHSTSRIPESSAPTGVRSMNVTGSAASMRWPGGPAGQWKMSPFDRISTSSSHSIARRPSVTIPQCGASHQPDV